MQEFTGNEWICLHNDSTKEDTQARYKLEHLLHGVEEAQPSFPELAQVTKNYYQLAKMIAEQAHGLHTGEEGNKKYFTMTAKVFGEDITEICHEYFYPNHK